MGGKTSKSTQAITVPPEVLARYNAVNTRADTVTNRPYQYYTGQFVAPLTATQQAGISNTNAAAGMAQPYFGAATGQLMGAQQAAMPYYQGATEQLGQGINTGQQLAGQSYNTLNNAQDIGSQLAGQSYNTLNNAQGVGNQLAGQSLETLGAAQNQAGGIQQTALNNFNAAYAGAQPYNQAAGGLYQQGLEQGRDFTGQSAYGTQQALAGAQPFQQAATQYMGSGAQAVNPYDLGADQINKYMSPYLSTVLQGTAGLLNQQNQQQQSGQMGNAIRSGAFGGDRAGIAAANLNQQQNLANSKIFSDLLNQGFGQALGTAQQQQQLGLGAQQANRAAQQQASQQALAIGQQGFGQGLSAAQQQGALGQQLFGMGATTGQNAAALGQQIYGQGTGTAAQQAALGQQIFGQGATAAAQQAALGQQQFGQGATTAAQQAALGQQQFGQGATTAAQQAALGQQQFGQGTAASQQAAALGQGLYGMGANTSSQLAGLGTGAQGAALSGAGAQLAAGQAEQATQQAENTAKYNEFLQAQSLPYQQLKLASDIALGTGTASGSTTTTAQPGGFFSDERLKENIKAVGKTFDGQTIHSYNYKGDPRTQIGLIAQEVQKHHPEAVGLAGGYKTVDYDKATEDASDRGHMASGGLASAGGSVMPYNAGQGFADGGFAGFDPATMQQMLAAQQAMYAPLSSNNMYAGGPNAGGGLVPQSEFAAGQLMVPAELARQATGAEKAKTIVDLGNSVNKFGESVGAWGNDDKKPADKNPEDKKNDGSYKYIEDEILNRALGGGIPYSGQGLDIPDSGLAAGSGSPMTASALQARQSGLDKLNKVANVADTGMKLGKFGKKIGLFADGGGIPYGGQGLDIPDEDDSSKTYQLPTAGDMPDKPKSGFSKAVKVAGTVAKIASMFSDKRMKENIKPIGKLFDGQIVHSYNYKGDPRTQIGLIAQEVEDHKPHAVGLAGKYKTVDYDKATSGAAKRGHFAVGGDPKMPVNSILASLRRDIDPRYALSDIAPEQDLDLQREERQGAGLAKIPETVGLAGAGKDGTMDLLQAGKPEPTGLAPTMGALPKGIMQIARLIHAGEGTGKNPSSSAKGPYQFVDGTFVGEFRKNYPDRAKGMSDDSIIALKRGPEGAAISSQMGPRFIANNAKIVERAGFEPDAGNVYLAHFLGPDTAVKVLRADPNAPISRYVSEEAIKANPPLQKNPTVRGTINWARGYMNQQAERLNRQERAFGGLAGRDGYAVDGTVIDNTDAQKKAEEDAALERAMQGIEFKDITPMPGSRAAGLMPEKIVEAEPPIISVPKGSGLGAVAPPLTSADLGLAAAGNPKLAPTSGAIGKGVNISGSQVSDPKIMAQNQERTKRGNVFDRVFGYDKSQPAYDPKTNNKFLQRLGHGETDAVLSAIQGIAAMGAAPTRSLGVALATGLGTGAQAFQGQREFGRQLRETTAVEASVRAKQDQANADIATARFNTSTLPNKIAGWRSIAAKGGKDAALAAQTANTLQGIFDAAQNDLGGMPAGGQKSLIPSDVPVPTEGAAGAPAKPRAYGDILADLQMQSLAGNPTSALEKELEKAGQGYRIGADGNFEIDPSYVSTKLGVEGPSERQSSNITTDVNVGERLYNNAIDENIGYQKANSIIQSIGSLPANQVPTTGFINKLAQAAGAAFGYTQAEMDAKFGEQPKINSILNAAAAEGINIDPSLGAAGVNVLIRALNDKARIAFIRAEAAKQFLRVTGGYSGGMEEFIDKALEANRRK